MRWARVLGAMLVVGIVAAATAADPPPTITVFAAASTTEAITDLATAYATTHGIRVVVSVGGSGMLARQIEAGAPADCFLSADEAWMDHLARAQALQPQTRRDLLGNALVVIAPAGAPAPAIRVGESLADRFTGRLALADPATVPAGRYAVAALQALGWWEGVRERLAPAADVRAALRLVAIQACALGIVYASDARQEPRVQVVMTIPATAHPAIRYPVALTAHATPAAAGFLASLASPAARARFAAAGFTVLPATAAAAGATTTGSARP